MSLQSKCLPGLQSPEGLTGAQGSTSKMVHHWLKMAHSHGNWQEASVPSILPSTCLWACLSDMTRQIASLKVSGLREEVGL